jgi:hypothetical protein
MRAIPNVRYKQESKVVKLTSGSILPAIVEREHILF